MAHNVETMAYSNEVPWHGLGVRVDNKRTVDQMLKAAKLDWKVERVPLFYNGGTVVEGFAGLVRDKDHAFFDVVGSQYVPVQNEEAFKIFVEAVNAGKATMETAGSLRGGKYVWGLANLNAQFKLSFTDVVKAYLLCVCPHEQGKSMIFKFTNIRVVCNNTLTIALREDGNEVRRTHRSAFDDDAVESIKEKLGIARDQMGEFEKTARKLHAKKFTQEATVRALAQVFQKEDIPSLLKDFDKNANRKMKEVMGALMKAPGAEPGTGWGILNAVTYYADHLASRTPDKRLTNAWLGKTANQKEAILRVLVEA